MPSRRTEIQVGIALVVALLLLIFGLSWFEDRQIGSTYHEIRVHFSAVGGLGAGDPVQVRGIAMGKVTDVSLDREGVMVHLRLKDDVTLRDDAVFSLGSAGIMGERMIAVEPGVGREVDPSSRVFEGVYQAASTELVGQFEEFNQRVMDFLARADSLMAQAQEDQLLRRTLKSTARAAETAAEVLGENRDELRRSARSLAELSERFARFLAAHEDAMGQGVDNLARASGSLDSLTTRLGTVLEGTQEIVDALREQRGPAGRMIFDEAAGENLVKSLEQLRFLVEDLQRNPQRYLTVKIF